MGIRDDLKKSDAAKSLEALIGQLDRAKGAVVSVRANITALNNAVQANDIYTVEEKAEFNDAKVNEV